MARSRRTTLLAGLIAAVWLVAMGAAFGWFEAHYLRPFNDRTTLFDGTTLRLPASLAGPGDIRLVHFRDPACPCNVGNQQHLAELMDHYRARGVSFYVVHKPGSNAQAANAQRGLQPLAGLTGSDHLPASPAVAIWNPRGELAYFGPYSSGFTCSSSNSFIEPVLDALLEGRDVMAGNNLASGCFCDWTQRH